MKRHTSKETQPRRGHRNTEAAERALIPMLGDVVTLVGPLYMVQQSQWRHAAGDVTHVVLVAHHPKSTLGLDHLDIIVMSRGCVSSWGVGLYFSILMDGTLVLARLSPWDVLETGWKRGTEASS